MLFMLPSFPATGVEGMTLILATAWSLLTTAYIMDLPEVQALLRRNYTSAFTVVGKMFATLNVFVGLDELNNMPCEYNSSFLSMDGYEY